MLAPRNNGRAIAAQVFATSQATSVPLASITTAYTSNPLRITDTLPTGVTVTSTPVGTNWTCTIGSGNFVCDYFAATPNLAYPIAALTNLAAINASVTFNVAACPGPVTNTLQISSGALESVVANNTATLASALGCSTNLQLTKSNGTSSVVAGGTTVYVLTVTNLGPAAADGALLLDPVSAGLSCTSVTCNPASATGGALCPVTLTLSGLQTSPGITLPKLPAGSSVAISLACLVTATGL